jgi:uncharacterized protein YneF (UPF0154 family)
MAYFGPAPDGATKALSAFLRANTLRSNATPKAQEEIYKRTEWKKTVRSAFCGDSHRTTLFATRRETIANSPAYHSLSARCEQLAPSETPEFVFFSCPSVRVIGMRSSASFSGESASTVRSAVEAFFAAVNDGDGDAAKDALRGLSLAPDGQPSPRVQELIDSGEWDAHAVVCLVLVDSYGCAGMVGGSELKFCGKSGCSMSTHEKTRRSRVVVPGWRIPAGNKAQGLLWEPTLPLGIDGGPIDDDGAALLSMSGGLELSAGQWRFMFEAWDWLQSLAVKGPVTFIGDVHDTPSTFGSQVSSRPLFQSPVNTAPGGFKASKPAPIDTAFDMLMSSAPVESPALNLLAAALGHNVPSGGAKTETAAPSSAAVGQAANAAAAPLPAAAGPAANAVAAPVSAPDQSNARQRPATSGQYTTPWANGWDAAQQTLLADLRHEVTTATQTLAILVTRHNDMQDDWEAERDALHDRVRELTARADIAERTNLQIDAIVTRLGVVETAASEVASLAVRVGVAEQSASAVALDTLRDAVHTCSTALFGQNGLVPNLSGQFRAFRERLEAGGGIECHGTKFSSGREVMAWYEEKNLESPAMFVDAIALLHGITASYVSRMDAGKRLELQGKNSHASDLEEIVVTSFQTVLPSVFCDSRTAEGSSAPAILKKKMKTFQEWRPKGEMAPGVATEITDGVKELASQVRVYRTETTTDANVRDLAAGLLEDSRLFCNELVAFIDRQNEALTSNSNYSAEQIWDMQLECVRKILTELSVARREVALAARHKPALYLWGMLRAWEIQQRYLENHFKDDPALTGILVRYIVMQSGRDGVKDKLAQFSKLQEQVADNYRTLSSKISKLEIGVKAKA